MLWCDMVSVVGNQARVGTLVFLVVFWPAEQVLGFGPKIPKGRSGQAMCDDVCVDVHELC